MERETAHSFRRSRPFVVLLILLAALAVSASIATQNARALPTFTQAVNGIGPCENCHKYTSGDAFHQRATHAAQSCSKCHTVSTATPPLPSACAQCHGGTTAILAKATHTATGCGTTVGCHGVTSTVVATTVALKVAPTSIKLKKTVKATGTVTPAATLAGVKVALKAEMKKGAKWVKAKAASAVVSATGTYTWTYKPGKKGSYRMTASIAATSTYKASTSKVRTFKVK